MLCVDEKSQIQALDRTAPILPLRAGLPEKATHDYVRHGTTTLFAALEIATGKVTDACYDRHGKAEFLDFLKKVARAYPRRQLHVVVDNYHTHKHPEVAAWLAKNPRVTLHFTPTSGSWLNLVEVFFGIITRQAIRRGTFTSVKELVTAISRFIDGWNDRCHPFTWTKTADEILPHTPGRPTHGRRGRRRRRRRGRRAWALRARRSGSRPSRLRPRRLSSGSSPRALACACARSNSSRETARSSGGRSMPPWISSAAPGAVGAIARTARSMRRAALRRSTRARRPRTRPRPAPCRSSCPPSRRPA